MTKSSCTKILNLEQREIYGSTRLGVITQEVRIAENASWPTVEPTQDTANAPFVLWNADSTYLDSVYINPFDSVGYKIKLHKYLGYRNYELSNHLGNVLAVISDRKYGEDADTDGEVEWYKPNVLSETDYYAFGSEVKERSVSGGYKFGFNGQMRDDEIYGTGNANTAMFWEYDTRLGRRWNLDQAMNPNQSNYSAFNNSPYFFNDIYGDDVDVSKIYEKDKNGSYKNKGNILAFELFAATKAGKKYLLDHAEKGFKLNGVFVKNLNISAEVEGKSSKNGVDVSIDPYNDHPSAPATTNGEKNNNRLKIKISVDNIGSLNKLSEKGGFRDKMLESVDNIGHEAFTHGEIREKQFLGSNFQRDSNNQHDYKLMSQTSYLTNIMYYSDIGYKGSEQFILNSKAVEMLNEVQNMNIHMNLGQKKYSQKELFNKFVSGGFLWKGLR